MKSAQIRNQIAEIDKIQVAVNTFRLKYNCKAGDCGIADQFGLGAWNCVAQPGGGPCNGNGDDQLQGFLASYPGSWPCEPFKFFEHLKNANLFPSPSILCGQGQGPKMALYQDSVLSIVTHGSSAIPTLMLSRFVAGINGGWATTALTPSDLYGIDSKMDDGLPGSGNVRGVGRSTTGNYDNVAFDASSGAVGSANCSSNTTPANYNTTWSDRDCIGLYYLQY